MTQMSRVEAIFFAALEKHSPAEQAAYLNIACAEQPHLRARVERLLAVHPRVGNFLDQEAAVVGTVVFDDGKGESGDQDPQVAVAGTIISGKYKLLQQIGEGGMGSVWMADQTEPVKRRVALKLIRVDRGHSKMILSRFEAERQAIALMDHPHIAKLLDAGTTPSGQPYFVMELVKGIPLTDYCDTHKLSVSERLTLFMQICSAVQHAHQKGIIHRDLKPTNILVESHDGMAIPKVIDFGLAKAASGVQLTERTLFTAFGNVLGTPMYMAPEQAAFNAIDVDTRADVYSLGVILYELLTGTTPISRETVKSAAFDEMLKLIREQEAPKPSNRLSTARTQPSIAANRSIDATKLSKLMEGDLDWMVLKALEKDRMRRYQTANAFAADIQRHLSNEPVVARPPSTVYRLQKLMRRNKLTFVAGLAIAASLVIGLAASIWQAARATQAERSAVAALDELRATAPAFAEQARTLMAQERFGEAIEKLDYALKLRPDTPEYLVFKGDLLQCQFNFTEAASTYRSSMRVKPDFAGAEASAKLCDELSAAPLSEQGKLTRESLAKLHLAMQRQQRPAAELMPVARLLGEEKKLVVEYWLTRLKDLPLSPEKPLEKRLSVREDGRLALDLSDTKLVDLSPLAGAPLGSLNLAGCKELVDFTPLSGFQALTTLDLSSTEFSDCSSLSGLSLESLDFTGTRVFNISSLRGMKLKKLSLRKTRVADLSPLVGMPLSIFDATDIPATDYAPLAGAPLDTCMIQNSLLRDLSFLKHSPVRDLALYGCDEARGYTVLANLESLETLILPQSFRELPDEELAAVGALRTHPTLKSIQTERRNGLTVTTAQSKEDFWKAWDVEQTFVPALRARGIKFTLSKLPNGTYTLNIQDQPLRDISILEGAPISRLAIYRSMVSDLAPLHNMPLEYLYLCGNPVTDLAPLRGKQITSLYLTGTKVSDLSPLTTLPLKELYLDSCDNVTDVAAIQEIATLENVTVPMLAANIKVIRSLPKLKLLAFKMNNGLIPETTAEEFWKEFEANPWVNGLRDAGVKISVDTLPDRSLSVVVHEVSFSDTSVFKGANISELNLNRTKVTDLSPLAGLPLKSLSLDGTPVSDLSPLDGMALENLSLRETLVTDLSVLRSGPLCMSLQRLFLYRTKVTDFSPVAACTSLTIFDATETALSDLEPMRGRQLRQAYFASTQIRDISILAGMPLQHLYFDRTAVIDVSPLLKCPSLETIILPQTAQSVDSLSALPRLSRISYTWDSTIAGPSTTIAEFWTVATPQQLAARKMEEQIRTLFAAGQVDAALPLLAETSAQNQSDTILALKAAALEAWFGKNADHEATCSRMIRWAASTNDPETAERVAKLISLRPTVDSQLRDAALVLARRGMELGQKTPIAFYCQMSLGMAEYRCGNLDAAESMLETAEGAAPSNPHVPGTAAFYRAMVLFEQGKVAEARQLFHDTEMKMKPLPKDEQNPLANGSDHDDVILWLSCKEAKALLHNPSTATP